MLKDHFTVIREFFKEFHHTGTLIPSSPWAAEALAEPIKHPRTRPYNILEVGPGTGVVTKKLLKNLQENDRLYICEINPRLMKLLQASLVNNPDYQRHRQRIEFFEGPVQDMPEDQKFDVVVCAVPFLNLDRKTVEEIFDKFDRLSTDDALMTYFEYIGLRSLSLALSSNGRKRRMQEIDLYFKQVFSERDIKRRRIWMNVLPINIYTLRLAA